MDENHRQFFGVRDLFWLAALAIVLALWGWDRGKLAARINTMAPATAPQPWRVVTGGIKVRALPVTDDFAFPIGEER
jgi:hypothetical protein